MGGYPRRRSPRLAGLDHHRQASPNPTHRRSRNVLADSGPYFRAWEPDELVRGPGAVRDDPGRALAGVLGVAAVDIRLRSRAE